MDDVVIACADLVGRSGATEFELGYIHDDAKRVEDAGWYASARYRGARLTSGERSSPAEAALALASRLMTGAMCRCGEPVTLADGMPGCRWRLIGPRWVPGCDAPSLSVPGPRGDLAAAGDAMGRLVARKAAGRG